MSRPVIALLSDFGLRDHYVGAMKGVILGICPEVTLVDITHDIEPYDIRRAARELVDVHRYFPDGTIFLVIVDPGVGSERRALAAEAGRYRFVAPDNGILSPVLREVQNESVVEVRARVSAGHSRGVIVSLRQRRGSRQAWRSRRWVGRRVTSSIWRSRRRASSTAPSWARWCALIGSGISSQTSTVSSWSSWPVGVRFRCVRARVSSRGSLRPMRRPLGVRPVHYSAVPITLRWPRMVAVQRPVSCSRSVHLCLWRCVSIPPPSMMDLDLTPEQRLLEQSVREWAAREVAPRIQELDRAHLFDRALVPQMASLGLLGASVPTAYGGAGMDYVSLGLACEELEYVDTSLRVILSVHLGLNCLTLLAWGTEDQKQRYLVPQAQGTALATYGLTEAAAGSDARGIESIAEKRGDHYYLSGEKTWISLADVADNFLVFAWTDLARKKKRDPAGLSAFIIEREFQGFSSRTLTEKWGILAGNTGSFAMDGVAVPERNLVGRPGEGFKIAMFALDQGRYTVAAGAAGLIRACRDASVEYAAARKTFGVEIGRHQLVKQMIAQMESDYQVSRLLWLRAGWLKNIGRRNTRETGLAKWFSTVAADRAAGDAVQVHGANGYSDEYPVGRYSRNSKGAMIYEGTREIHTLMQADYALGYRTDRPVRCDLPAYGSL